MTRDDHIEASQALSRAERDRRERQRERSLVVVWWVLALAGLVALVMTKLLGYW